MIQFNTPEWFFLIPLLLAAGWKYRRLRLASPLRLLLQTCLLLALAQPALDRGGKDMDLWVLVDQSNSTAGIPAAGAEEIQAILERHKHAGDRVRLVDFAQSAVLRGRGDPVFAGGTSGTDMEQALAYTMALMSPNRTNRILMLTDGWPTTPLDQAAEQLIQSRIPPVRHLPGSGHPHRTNPNPGAHPARRSLYFRGNPGRPSRPGHHRSVANQQKRGGSAAGDGYPAQRQSHGEAGGQALHPRLFRL